MGSFSSLGQLPRDGFPQIAFAGRSNVGKSSLLNSLVGSKMAKVSGTPGKTRALNFFLVNRRFYFVDLPGYGYGRLSKQVLDDLRRLTQEYLNHSRALAGLILLLDCRREITADDAQMLAWLAERGLPAIAAVTKADKLNRDQLRRKVDQVERTCGVTAIPFSVVTGQGKRELAAAVLELLKGDRDLTD